MKLEEHPTVRSYRQRQQDKSVSTTHVPLSHERLITMAREEGADDVGLVDIQRSSLDAYRQDLIDVMPDTSAIMCLAFKVNREALRASTHSIADIEFKHMWMKVNRVARKIVSRMQALGIRALNAPASFPYEAERWPGKMWFACDKIFAIEAGLGQMGLNRLVLHPHLGGNILLGNILIAGDIDRYDQPIDYNPCIECKLCAAVCPVGAIRQDWTFDFFSCYTHNYRERLGGFQDWVENVVESKNRYDYRHRFSDAETISMWQNLSIAAQTRCDRCMAVCPAGEEAIGEYLEDRKKYRQRIVTPFNEKRETIYVVAGSDAEAFTAKRFPAKTVKRISNGLRPNSAESFLQSLPLVFQKHPSQGLNATFHFSFSGAENCEGTVTIRDQTISVEPKLTGQSDLHVFADSRTWIDFLSGEKNLVWALLTRKIRIKGSPSLMKAFAKCFPS